MMQKRVMATVRGAKILPPPLTVAGLDTHLHRAGYRCVPVSPLCRSGAYALITLFVLLLQPGNLFVPLLPVQAHTAVLFGFQVG